MISTASLLVAAGASAILDVALSVGRTVGLDVDSWEQGDPTRSNYEFLSEVLARVETQFVGYVRSGFLSTSEGEWLTVKAREDYGIEPGEATYSTPTVTVQNTSGSFYQIEQVGDFIVKATSTGKSFANTQAPIDIAPGGTVAIECKAQEAGSDSTVAADEIDEIVTSLPGVVVVSSTSAGARDDDTEDAIREQCLSATGPTSPNGPADGYEHVARSPEYTGATDVTRARGFRVGAGGFVDLYVASVSGAVLAESVPLVQAAIEKWCTPLGFTPTVKNAATTSITLTATIKGANLPAGYAAKIEAEIVKYFGNGVKIGGLVSLSQIDRIFHRTIAEIETVDITSHDDDIQLAIGRVPVLADLVLTEVN